jgi:hypothetical protein
MNWDAIGAIGEIIGAIAVVVSLIYLAAQIRQNSNQVSEQIRALELQAYDTTADTFTNFRTTIAANEQLASLWRRGKESFNELALDEQAQINELFTELFWAYDSLLRKKQSEAIDEGLWLVVEENIEHWLKNNGIREWWEANVRPPHSPDFEVVVEKVYAKLYGSKQVNHSANGT